MKRVQEKLMICGTALIVCFLLEQNAPSQNTSRTRISINDNWRFLEGDVVETDLPNDVQNWKRVTLPHTWNARDVLDDEPGYRRGVGRYRRQLELNRSLRTKRLFILFEGANQVARVSVNGQHAGNHVGGYTAFSFEITDFVRFGDSNEIEVTVDNSLVKDIPPIDGDFNMYGGIYRDVWIVAVDPVHVKVTDYASSGIVIRTPRVSAETATVEVAGTIVNSTDEARDVEIVNTLVDPNGRPEVTFASKIRIGPTSETSFKQTSNPVRKPLLWSPGDPNLYTVRTTVRENSRVLDEVSNPLGFRWFRFDAEKGFFLNDRPLKLRGTNRHQDRAGLGNAIPDRLHVRDLEIIKENGFNFLRLAHYPQDPSVLDAADRLGLLIWEEIPIVNQIHVSEKFNENAATMLREMVRQHRNHPSIIIWGYMNEVFLPVPKTGAIVQATVRLARDLEAICRTEDPTRATAIAFDWGARDLYNSSGLGSVSQIVGWNLYHGWYYETFEDFGKFLDDQHRRFPDRPLVVSEYGANGDRRVHSVSPKRFDSSIEWQQMFHEAYLPQIESRSFVAGSAIWNQFDFGSEFRGETIPHINQKGMYTFERKPKDISYYYRANYSNEPVVYLAVGDWLRRSGPRSQVISVYSNLDQVEIFLNGSSLGTRQIGSDRKANVSVNFVNGRNLLRAVGRRGARRFSHQAEAYFYDPASKTDIAVNCGSNAEVTDAFGTIWQADLPATGQRAWANTGTSASVETHRNILGTIDEPIYQTMREGVSAYRFDVPDGRYEIELRFVEPKFRTAGERVFDIAVNGRTQVKRMDPAGEAGYLKHLSQKLFAHAADGNGLVIDLISVKGSPIISGIKLKRVN